MANTTLFAVSIGSKMASLQERCDKQIVELLNLVNSLLIINGTTNVIPQNIPYFVPYSPAFNTPFDIVSVTR